MAGSCCTKFRSILKTKTSFVFKARFIKNLSPFSLQISLALFGCVAILMAQAMISTGTFSVLHSRILFINAGIHSTNVWLLRFFSSMLNWYNSEITILEGVDASKSPTSFPSNPAFTINARKFGLWDRLSSRRSDRSMISGWSCGINFDNLATRSSPCFTN